MIKILGKLTIDNKLVKDYLYFNPDNFSIDDWESYIRDICYHLDIPVPISLVKHIKNYIMFNSTFYTADDFVDTINFDKFVIENVKYV